jgi:hypothetical protein
VSAMIDILLAFCAGVLSLIVLVLVRGRILQKRWYAERLAAAEREREKFLNRGERRRRRQARGGR